MDGRRPDSRLRARSGWRHDRHNGVLQENCPCPGEVAGSHGCRRGRFSCCSARSWGSSPRRTSCRPPCRRHGARRIAERRRRTGPRAGAGRHQVRDTEADVRPAGGRGHRRDRRSRARHSLRAAWPIAATVQAMSEDQWTLVDQYIEGLFVGADPALDAALRRARPRACRRSRLAVAGQAAPASGDRDQGARASSRSARSAATARSGWRARCRPTAG